MKTFVLPVVAGFILGVSGAAVAGPLEPHGKTVPQDRGDLAATAAASGPRLLTDSQMEKIVAGGEYQLRPDNNTPAGSLCVLPDAGYDNGFNGGTALRAGKSAGHTYHSSTSGGYC